jgi:hypothetical protein
MLVYCVLCVDHDNDVVHIFSSHARALAFADSDERDHVIYDYMIDCPERMEQSSPSSEVH